jgi:hypothetical protein
MHSDVEQKGHWKNYIWNNYHGVLMAGCWYLQIDSIRKAKRLSLETMYLYSKSQDFVIML